MVRKPSVITPAQLAEAARAAAAVAAEERIVVLSDTEAREVSGGALAKDPFPILMGFFPTNDPVLY